MDKKDVSEKNVIAAINAMNRIHIRRAHLLGLDAPAKFDVRTVYRATDEMTQERQDTERTWLAMSREERALIYDTYDAAARAWTRRSKPQPR